MASTTKPADPTRTAQAAPIVGAGLVILLILDLAYCNNAMDRQLFPVLLPDIRQALDISDSQIGLLATIFTLGMGLAGIPAGYLTDKLGRKNVILAGLVIFSAATALQALAVGFFDMGTYRVVSGVGEGLQNAALFAAAGSYFHRRRGLAIGTLSAAYGMGAFSGPFLGNWLVDLTGHWETPFVVFGLLGAVVLVAVLFGVPREAADYGAKAQAGSVVRSMDVVASERLFNRTMVCSAVVAVGAGFALNAFLGLYPTFLRESLGFSRGQASLTASMFGIGALGALVGGTLADRISQRLLNVVGLLVLMGTGIVIFTVPAPQGVEMALTVLMGVAFTGVIYTNTSTLMQRSVSPSLVGRAQGAFLASLYVPASISGYLFATAVDGLGWATAGVIVMAAPCVVGLIGMAALGPRYAGSRAVRDPLT
jgi:predicted MFS family arabinose efflux permease